MVNLSPTSQMGEKFCGNMNERIYSDQNLQPKSLQRMFVVDASSPELVT
jgi:hypothetical protein